ncbi:MAG: SAM-dependent methyltransferase [Flavobacteriales bacterium]|nr:SAM-dependent methyltransferase [Flavobacteriales bacterium]
MTKGKVFLLPMTLGESDVNRVIPQQVQELIISFKFLVVENIKTTRRYLKHLDKTVNIDEINFFELNKHTDRTAISEYLDTCQHGNDIGIISEAGCPAIADPGSDLVAIAHEKNIQVVPLVGPSSILMALMGSGFSGQSFTFNGYLNKDKLFRQKEIRQLESSAQKGTSQIFMETPFRNQALLEDLLSVLRPETKLCIAVDITLNTEFVVTKMVKDWRSKLPNLNKRPTVFVLG